ncbi:hypothetical protein [Actinoplanes awajinensis]|uniref:SMI1/KNR4 family protein n=1 Tax=Actinoplanes awajinensis subsp. mycoplanecinus TaxID=135947 RepID=A0A117MPE8_9ACTN|nr:hypothetical protein [Actinoplanes awajinensis]KUL28541.1 hypothetical protein ADL15_31845 [Actinoplanes awajinensis subsp. mycoplanecinus]
MTAVDELREKVGLFRRLAAEHDLDVRIEDPVELPEIPGCPPGLRAAFSDFSLAEGTFFRFRVPPAILDARAWAERPILDYLPVDPVTIGHELWRARAMGGDRILEGEGISVDPEQGDVYYADTDTWLRFSEGYDGDFEAEDLAPDVPTFFTEYVFGPRYPELVTLVLGAGAPEHRDSWLRLLRTAGVLPSTGRVG